MKQARNILILLLLWASAAHAVESSALGIKPGDVTTAVAHENTRLVESCRESIHFPAAKFCFEIPVHYRPNGGKLTGEGGPGLRTSEDAAANDDNAYYMICTRFVPVNPATDRDFLLLCGTGQGVHDIQIHGRRWKTFPETPTGPRARACIAIQSLKSPPTGRHSITDCLLADADVGLATLEGGGDTHADLLRVDNVYASNCRAFFQSGNWQSVSHTFTHCFMENDGPCVGFELLRGGKIDVFGFRQNSPMATVLVLGNDLAPNCNWAGIYGYHWDHADVPGAYFCPLDSGKTTMAGCLYGHANNPQFRFERLRKGLQLNPAFKCEIAGVGK